jgi:hypothetical protein
MNDDQLAQIERGARQWADYLARERSVGSMFVAPHDVLALLAEVKTARCERDEAITQRDEARSGYQDIIVALAKQFRSERDAARERVSTLTGLLDRAVAAVGMDEVADLFVGTEDENAYETFMAEAQRALAVDGTDTPTPATVSCKTCAGTGEYPPTNGVTCPWCDGEGEVPAGDTSTANPETDE